MNDPDVCFPGQDLATFPRALLNSTLDGGQNKGRDLVSVLFIAVSPTPRKKEVVNSYLLTFE